MRLFFGECRRLGVIGSGLVRERGSGCRIEGCHGPGVNGVGIGSHLLGRMRMRLTLPTLVVDIFAGCMFECRHL